VPPLSAPGAFEEEEEEEERLYLRGHPTIIPPRIPWCLLFVLIRQGLIREGVRASTLGAYFLY